MKKLSILLLLLLPFALSAQNVMTPELLWKLGKVAALGISPDNNTLLYQVGRTDLKTEKNNKEYFFLDLKAHTAVKTDVFSKKQFVQWDKNGIYAREKEELFLSKDQGKTWKAISRQIADAENVRVSPDGQWLAFSKPVASIAVLGKEIYKDAKKSTAQIYTDLNYRHWDQWNDGKVSHVFVANIHNPRAAAKDILQDEPYDCPQKPFGGSEDFIFSPDSRTILYVCKKKTGKEYAQSTNTDIYAYDIGEAKTTNITEGMAGYDQAPQFSKDGKQLAWLSMKTEGFEADKNDIIVMNWPGGTKINITEAWDETVDGNFIWGNNSKTIYLSASI
jgi:Tol biopolymer transport system component